MTLPRFEASPGVPLVAESPFVRSGKIKSMVWPPCRFCGSVDVTDANQTCRECWRVAVLAPAAIRVNDESK